MGAGEIILIVFCSLVVIGVVVATIIRKKQGKTSCDCGGDCSCCSACKTQKPSTKK